MSAVHESEVILEAKGLTRKFSGFAAVDGVDARIRLGSAHALIGQNGGAT
jgi:branched-chain amino acid transport system ATP-binding protein